MKVLSIENRDVYVVMELSLKQISYLKQFLDNSNIEYNSKQNPELAEAVEYVKNTLYPQLDEISHNVED